MSANTSTSILGEPSIVSKEKKHSLQSLCTRTIQTRRFDANCGRSQIRKFQVSLLFVDHRIVS